MLDKILKQTEYVVMCGPNYDIREENYVDAVCGKDSIDIIVTDPPYGFNVDIPDEELISIYEKWIKNSVSLLNDGGQLLFCLPERSYNGQQIKFYSMKEMVTRQVMIEANRADKEAVIVCDINPKPSSLLSPPYYWHAERVLSRSILHFEIRKRIKKT